MRITLRNVIITLFLLACWNLGEAQSPHNVVKDSLRRQNFNGSQGLASDRALNILLSRRVSNYLTGSTDLTLFQSYATYSAEKDKLNFGFNIPYPASRSGDRVRLLLNPMIETGVKENFATFYKKGKWQNGLRIGFKGSYIFGGKINYYTNIEGAPLDTATQRGKMIARRLKILASMLQKVDSDYAAYLARRATIQNELRPLAYELPELSMTVDEVDTYSVNKKQEEFRDEFAKLEADLLEEPHSYSYTLSYWISMWGFYPLVGDSLYTTPTAAELFKKKKSSPWEFALQGNVLFEGIGGALFGSATYMVFQNNSAKADLLTKVDYNRYVQLPGTNPINLAELESSDAYIGDYKQFVTSSISAQLVYMLPLRGFFNAGISGRWEKNYGDYSAVNWKLGMPFRFKGKEKPVTVEVVALWNDVANYADMEDHDVEPTIGLNAGLPFTALFK